MPLSGENLVGLLFYCNLVARVIKLNLLAAKTYHLKRSFEMYIKSSVHSRLVQALVDLFEENGYRVQADDIGHPNGSPDPVNGYVPDVVAHKVGKMPIIAEAEDCDSIYSEHTRDQWRAFSNAYGFEFHIIVPTRCLDAAQQQAWRWGIRVDKWRCMDI